MIRSRRVWRLGLAGAGGLALAAMTTVLCYAQVLSPRPEPGPLTAVAVPLDPAHPARTKLGALTYAGGLMLSAGASSRFGGLSGLTVEPDATGHALTINAVSDEGGIARFQATLDAEGRLTGASNLRFSDLYEDGRSVGRGKAQGDAEDISQMHVTAGYITYVPEFFVSFENDNRVLAMTDPGDRTGIVDHVSVPDDARNLPTGQGLEALASSTNEGVPSMAYGAENGRIWLCIPEGAHKVDPKAVLGCKLIQEKPTDATFRLTGLTALDGTEDFIALYRSLDPIRGWRARIELLAKAADGYHLHNLAKLSPPMTVDNMEGVAVTPLPDNKGWRLYLISDDNFRPEERTLLLAFDWRRS